MERGAGESTKMGARRVGRRPVVLSALGGAALGATSLGSRISRAEPGESEPSIHSFIAKPPAGFRPYAAPGVVTKVEAKGDFASMMQPNHLWPKPEVARSLVERALTDLTGAPNVDEAMKRFIHPADTVAIKVNGIAGQVGYTVAVNYEVILPVVQAVLAVGVPPERITIYEQFPAFLQGTRVNVGDWKLPDGVKTGTHNNRDHAMPEVRIFEDVPTKYCRFFTDATAVIDMTMMKHHHLCGFTGAMKNITHGNVNNPHHHHAHQASPQIALLYNHPIVQSRVRLHLVDAFKVLYDKGPLDEDPRMRVPHGAVYASTDAVALDTIGTSVIDHERKERGGRVLAGWGLYPRYLHRAAELGIGLHDMSQIRLKTAKI